MKEIEKHLSPWSKSMNARLGDNTGRSISRRKSDGLITIWPFGDSSCDQSLNFVHLTMFFVLVTIGIAWFYFVRKKTKLAMIFVKTAFASCVLLFCLYHLGKEKGLCPA
jgi:hypothetical protein